MSHGGGQKDRPIQCSECSLFGGLHLPECSKKVREILMRKLKGYAVRTVRGIFYYTDGHYSYYDPFDGRNPLKGIFYTAADTMKAISYAEKDGLAAEVVTVHLGFGEVNMDDFNNDFNEARIADIKSKMSQADIDFIKKHL